MQTSSKFPENLPAGWKSKLAGEISKPYFKSLTQFLNKEYSAGQEIYPPKPLILRAIQERDYDDVKVVILGQDPYHGPGQAIGLSFGVPNDLRIKPPSLQNIFKELNADLGIQVPPGVSDLTGWAEQGVLLLNTALTVRKGQAFSHRGQGWEIFTDEIIRALSERKKPLVFILWGAAAIGKKKIIREVSQDRHQIIESPHPSPLSASRGFFGSKPFSKANAMLKSLGEEPVDWLKISARREA